MTKLIIFTILINLALLATVASFTPPTTTDYPVFTQSSLARFDGSLPNLPIYLALDGLVYDVTAGSDYYNTSGKYHFLAGHDSSAMLHLAGAAIIKNKYPVIGRLVP